MFQFAITVPIVDNVMLFFHSCCVGNIGISTCFVDNICFLGDLEWQNTECMQVYSCSAIECCSNRSSDEVMSKLIHSVVSVSDLNFITI